MDLKPQGFIVLLKGGGISMPRFVLSGGECVIRETVTTTRFSTSSTAVMMTQGRFLTPSVCPFFFVIPQVGKRDDETYLGFRKSHALSRAAVRSRHRDLNP